jgi:hypothetical protein
MSRNDYNRIKVSVTNKILLDNISIHVIFIVNLILLLLVGVYAKQEGYSNSKTGLVGTRRRIRGSLKRKLSV